MSRAFSGLPVSVCFCTARTRACSRPRLGIFRRLVLHKPRRTLAPVGASHARGFRTTGRGPALWDLTSFPSNIYPDEIMSGQVAISSYLNPAVRAPSVFSTVWGEVDLPAFWFLFVAGFIKLFGSSLWVLRLPGALFGVATVVPFYALVRSNWGGRPPSRVRRCSPSARQTSTTAASLSTTSSHLSSGPSASTSCCAACRPVARSIGFAPGSQRA